MKYAPPVFANPLTWAGPPHKPDESVISDAELASPGLTRDHLKHELQVVNQHLAYQRELVAGLEHERERARLEYQRWCDDIDRRTADINDNMYILRKIRQRVYTSIYTLRRQHGPDDPEATTEHQP